MEHKKGRELVDRFGCGIVVVAVIALLAEYLPRYRYAIMGFGTMTMILVFMVLVTIDFFEDFWDCVEEMLWRLLGGDVAATLVFAFVMQLLVVALCICILLKSVWITLWAILTLLVVELFAGDTFDGDDFSGIGSNKSLRLSKRYRR